MVSAVGNSSAFLTSGGTPAAGASPRGEEQRIKAEIQSARGELECTTCEGDKEKLETQIKDLQSALRRVQTNEVQAPPADDARGQGTVTAPNTDNNAEAARQTRFDPADPSTWTQTPPADPKAAGQILDITV